jgi:hypothetical protein
MSRLFPKPHPEFEALQIELLRAAPPWRNMEIVGQMNAAVRGLAVSDLRVRYPEDPPEEIRWRLAELYLGPEQAAKVYGSLGEVEEAGITGLANSHPS